MSDPPDPSAAPSAVTPAAIRRLLQADPARLEAALAMVYTGRDRRIGLDGARLAVALSGAGGPEEIIAGHLAASGRDGQFAAYLASKDAPLAAAPGLDAASRDEDGAEFGGEVVIGPVDGGKNAWDLGAMARFAARASAYRCRIRVGGAVAGSGAFVSPRLVLTAGHVVEAAVLPGGPAVEVMTADGAVQPARIVWYRPCHDLERQGGLPPAEAGAGHCDAALLRIERPLGYLFGMIDLRPDPDGDWAGVGRMVLVHYPEGRDSGIAFGKIRRGLPGELRQFHNVDTAGGSSGGPGFDWNYRFLGLHQGRWKAFRRLVPYRQFAGDPGFRAALDGDRPLRHLWSLDGSLDGPMVIGRERLFLALGSIAEAQAGHSPGALRGLWIKRLDTSRTEGLDFTFHILQAFLKARGAPARVVRLSTELRVMNLLEALRRAALAPGDGATEDGLAEGEGGAGTLDPGQVAARAAALAAALNARAEAEGGPIWIYVDNPPTGLVQTAQVELEHLVRAVLTQPGLYLVLTGFETYDLVPALYETLEEATRRSVPGLMVEYIGRFRQLDVRTTAQGMSLALGLDWEGEGGGVLSWMVRRALRALPEAGGGQYDEAHFEAVSTRLRDEARRDM